MKKLILLFTMCLMQFVLHSQSETKLKQLKFGMFSDDDYLTAPAVSFDGKYLIFTVKNKSGYKFYESKIDEGKVSDTKELSAITEFLGEATYKNSPVYNFDASKIYFSADNNGNKDIFVSSRTADNSWSKPEALPDAINTAADEDEPSISSSDNDMYFVRFENEKEADCGTMYVSYKNNKHKWQKAVAIIKPLNSGCERTPRILSDNKTLLFASKREKSKEFKIYYAKNPYDDVWYLPKTIGALSKYNEMYPTNNYKGTAMHFAISNKNKTSRIFSLETPPSTKPGKMKILSGKVVDEKDKAIKATIDLLNPYSLVSEGLYNNKIDGTYSLFLSPKSKLLIDYSGKKMSHKFEEYDNSKLKSDKETINAVLFNDVNLLLKIYDRDIYEPIDAEIKVFEKATNTEITCPTQQQAAGRYSVIIPIGKVYTIRIESEFTKPSTLDFDLSGVVVYKNYIKNMEVESQKVAYTFNVSDESTGKGISCQIKLTNMNSKQKIVTTATTDQNGNVTIFARKGDYYSVAVNPKGYTFHNTKIDVNDDTPRNIKVKLKKFKKDMTMDLKNITFETNSADLNEASYDELERVVNMLSRNPSIKVEISAHTDDVGSDKYNLLLSDRRAESVVKYLTKRNIEIERMIFKGYGETKPLLPNTSDENRAQNRRVELKITDIE